MRGGDDGVHRIIVEPDGETAAAFDEVVSNVLSELEAWGQKSQPTLLPVKDGVLLAKAIGLSAEIQRSSRPFHFA